MESVLMQRAGAMNLLSFLLNDMTEENRKLKLITFPGETVVITLEILFRAKEQHQIIRLNRRLLSQKPTG